MGYLLSLKLVSSVTTTLTLDSSVGDEGASSPPMIGVSQLPYFTFPAFLFLNRFITPFSSVSALSYLYCARLFWLISAVDYRCHWIPQLCCSHPDKERNATSGSKTCKLRPPCEVLYFRFVPLGFRWEWEFRRTLTPHPWKREIVSTWLARRTETIVKF